MKKPKRMITKVTNRRFTKVYFKGTVRVNGEVRDISRRVYQRHDINLEYVDSKTGLSNFQLMQSGQTPIGSDGKPVELHHVLQQERGSMVEIREVTHREYSKQLHGLYGPGESFRNNSILSKRYINFRKAYWKWRASQYKGA